MASIRQDPKSRKWIVDFKKGLSRRRLFFTSRRDAEDFRREFLLRDSGCIDPKLEQKSLGEAVDRYLKAVTAVKAPRTQTFESTVFRNFQSYFSRNVSIHDFGLAEAQNYQAHLKKNQLGQSVNRQFNTLKHFFKTLHEWHWIIENPCVNLKKLPETGQKAKRVFRVEELSLLFQAAKPWLRNILWFTLVFGTRRSQSCALRWDSVDLHGKFVHLEASEGFDPKDYEPNSIPMNSDMFEFLSELNIEARKRFKAKPNDHVFLDDLDNPILPDRLTHESHKLLKSVLGLEHGAVHIFRRTSVTLRHRQGVSLNDVKSIAGHSNVKTTALYLVSEPEHLREQLDKTPLLKPFWIKKK